MVAPLPKLPSACTATAASRQGMPRRMRASTWAVLLP
jgi:hypothetical protein